MAVRKQKNKQNNNSKIKMYDHFPMFISDKSKTGKEKKKENFFFFLGMIVMVDAWQYDNIYNPHIYLNKNAE